ncbi:phasin family protein [Draconibacterium orientale]|uniref:phasin family protein n=1 Tax=Draconibacterium orientale TaxID=1168034 RepID=UPI0029C018AB|nr:phasin family protein [Draconibacterium orientale]
MIELLKKGILTGIGFGLLTKDKILDLVKKTAEEAKLSEEEARKLADELLKQSEEAKQNLNKKIDGRIKDYIDSLGIATKKDIDKINEELKLLKKKTE